MTSEMKRVVTLGRERCENTSKLDHLSAQGHEREENYNLAMGNLIKATDKLSFGENNASAKAHLGLTKLF